ncbi:SDR family NAD(P)-dependent oxidoreductase [Alcaligenaceae bacterium]|nr:SDR family NAD(P)-dependent oxidoreductase [Alcaligenaceae bacterium]
MKLDGLAAVVTGGASGLGGATVRMLAENGAKVTIFDLDEKRGTETAREVGGRYIAVDVTDKGSIEQGLEQAEQSHGVARILVNCAGIAPVGRVVDKSGAPHDIALFRKAVEVNLIGTFNMLSVFAARLSSADVLGEERGVVINTASVAAYDGQIGQCAYAASKGGVVALTLPAARDLAKSQIRVMTIAPGIFITPMLTGLPQAAQDSLGQQVPHPSRLGQPDEYASLVKAIIDNPMLNGEVIRLDGAIRMAPR